MKISTSIIAYITPLLPILFAAAGCGVLPKAATTDTARDSTRTEIKERIVFIPDTVFMEIPAQSAERETSDTSSFLENDFASSEAQVSNGTLRHTLDTKPQQRPSPTKTKVIYKDSILYRDRYQDREVVRTIEVERDYNAWDKARFYGCYAMAALLLFKYRKKLLSVLKRIFGI